MNSCGNGSLTLEISPILKENEWRNNILMFVWLRETEEPGIAIFPAPPGT
jgi:hypothetical protein